MTDRDESYLEDMLAYAVDAIELLADADASALAVDKMRRYAVIRAVEVVGEAASKVSRERRDSLPDLPWRAAIGMRNVLIHNYVGLELAIVADTVRNDFPNLVRALRRVLGDRPS
jgi:uncharacterized protein with HEPN domain